MTDKSEGCLSRACRALLHLLNLLHLLLVVPVVSGDAFREDASVHEERWANAGRFAG